MDNVRLLRVAVADIPTKSGSLFFGEMMGIALNKFFCSRQIVLSTKIRDSFFIADTIH